MAQITISPGTSDLGTITSDIQYTVTSDTTGTLTASIVVNGAPFAQQALTSGVPSAISVMQLPTGAGNISLTATLVESGGGATTQNVTWTYTKTPINFSNSGSVASLAINGENILPTTLTEAVRTSPVWGGSLDLALQKLSNAAFYETVAPTAQLGSLAEGSIIYLNENGSPVEFYVAKQNYEPSYNTGRVLVVRKDVYNQLQWNRSDVNTWATSTIHSWLNSTYKTLLDSNIQEAIATTTYRYTPGNGNNTVTTRSDAVFLLSLTELGLSYSTANVEGSTLPIASTLKIAYQGGSATDQWTRSPDTSSTINSWAVSSNGNVNNAACNASLGSRPAFTLPSTFTAYIEKPTTGLYDLSNNLLLKLPGVQIETGSYVGTGVTGSENKNQLTFGFVPKYWGIVGYRNEYSTYIAYIGCEFFPWGQFNITHGDGPSSNGEYQLYAYYDDKKVSWYGTSDTAQFNHTGWTYYYWAIG